MKRSICVLVSCLSFCSYAVGQRVITTFAGSNWTYPASVTVALNAPLGRVGAVAADSQGNIYVADLDNDRIFLVTSDAGIRIVAGNGTYGYSGDGGQAASASLDLEAGWAGGIAVDASGNLFIADTNNFRVRKVSASGIITTVAGSGNYGFSGDGGPATSASLSQVKGVAVSPSGDIFIADTGNNRIRKVSAGIITTAAGSDTAGFSGDNGPAISASLNVPIGVAVDSSGNIFVADYNNGRIRKVSAGIITTVAGGGNGYLGGFDHANAGGGGPATSAAFSSQVVGVDATGNLFIADELSDRIWKVSAATGFITNVAGSGPGYTDGGYSGDGGSAISALLYLPEGVAADGSGNLFIADTGNERIRKVSATGVITTVAGNGNFSFSGDGGIATSALLNVPTNAAADGSGNLFIADTGNKRIRKVSASGVITTVAGNGSPGFSGDGGSATSASLNLYPTGGYSGVAVDNAGNLFIVDTQDGVIRKVSATGVITTVVGGGSGGLGDGGPATLASVLPYDVAADASGNLFITDWGHNRIRKVATSSVITTVAGNGSPGFSGDGGVATSALLNVPVGIAVDASGNIFFSDYSNNRIRKVSASGLITTVAGNGTAGFSGDGGPAISASLNQPLGVAVDASGNIFFSDYANSRIREVSASGLITTVAGNGHAGFSGDGGSATSAELRSPSGIAVDASGNLYIADSYNSRTREVLAAGSLATQTITFAALGNVSLGIAPFTISATASSGLAVSVVSTTPAICTVAGNTVTILAVGTCTLMATQAGNASFSAADPVVRSFTVNPPSPTAAPVREPQREPPPPRVPVQPHVP